MSFWLSVWFSCAQWLSFLLYLHQFLLTGIHSVLWSTEKLHLEAKIWSEHYQVLKIHHHLPNLCTRKLPAAQSSVSTRFFMKFTCQYHKSYWNSAEPILFSWKDLTNRKSAVFSVLTIKLPSITCKFRCYTKCCSRMTIQPSSNSKNRLKYDQMKI